MVADMVAFVASQFTTSTWDVGAQELCSVVLICFILFNKTLYYYVLYFLIQRSTINLYLSAPNIAH